MLQTTPTGSGVPPAAKQSLTTMAEQPPAGRQQLRGCGVGTGDETVVAIVVKVVVGVD